MVGIVGFEGNAINVWLIWILPFVGASIIPASKSWQSSAELYRCGLCVGQCLIGFGHFAIRLINGGNT